MYWQMIDWVYKILCSLSPPVSQAQVSWMKTNQNIKEPKPLMFLFEEYAIFISGVVE